MTKMYENGVVLALKSNFKPVKYSLMRVYQNSNF